MLLSGTNIKNQRKPMIQPYIGITDFMKRQEAERMLAVFKKHAPADTNRILHVGVMMSRKTLNGLPTSFAKAFPKNEDIASIFHSNEVLNCLHYADYNGQDRELAKNLAKAISFGGERIHALQLDMVWPDPDSIAKAVKESGKLLKIILQVGKGSLEEVEDDPNLLVERLEEYSGIIDCVLLDKSMGHGLGLDAEELGPFAEAIRDAFPKMSLAAAGGLGPDTLHLVEPLLSDFPELSIDAEGRLRKSNNIMDPIDWNMAETYLAKALKLLT